MLYRRFQTAIITVVASILMSSCQDIASRLPSGAVDPKYYNTPEAAQQMAAEVRYEFQLYMIDFFLESGHIADEFDDQDSLKRIPGEFNEDLVLNQRYLPDEAIENTPLSRTISQVKSYGALQRIRSIASLARSALKVYAPESLPSERGEMYIYEAFANVMLADLYCSGIPLSTVDFDQDYTYRPGSSTLDVYQGAVSLFDSALTLTGQEPTITALAQVGKARALLALGRVSDAAQAVTGVPEGFRFSMPLFRGTVTTPARLPTGNNWPRIRILGSVGDRKGEIGLPFVSARDPRILLQGPTTSQNWSSPQERTEIVIASYVEAKLIEAELLIHTGDEGFIDVLNDLRTDGTFTVDTNDDTVYNAGTGEVAGLPPLQDPAVGMIPVGQTAFDARIDLLMRERAFWLFFTGHRQGDLRRLVRNYDRSPEGLYPRGESRGGLGYFDIYIDVPIPNTERFNPHFSGCLGRGE